MKRLFVLVALAVAALPAAAAEEPRTPFCPPVDPPAAARPLAGLRAFRDPVTGRLRKPTAGELAAMAAAKTEAVPERQPFFEVIVHPDGMKTVDLQGAFEAAAVALRNPDGSITIRCGPDHKPGALPAAARPALEEK